ncbi:MAG TPA: proline dehydrogenase family protein [Candidatus Acidoferrales bacterium]|nr:proline dehydrogenase family protein [Candidatus Acidoferrales bacterium]
MLFWPGDSNLGASLSTGASEIHMKWVRQILIAASENSWLRKKMPRLAFVRRAAARFLPGEKMDDALAAANHLLGDGMSSLLTHLGENVADRAEAQTETEQYLGLLDRIQQAGLPSEISVKLTQLGLDIDAEFCFANLVALAEHSPNETIWIDMEQSRYVDATLALHARARKAHANVGVCAQAYLRRTAKDIESLTAMGASVRLVKGAYSEPPEIAFAKKKDVDENYFRLAQSLLSSRARAAGVRGVMATHDANLIARIAAWASAAGIEKKQLEFAMLYGIQRREQLRLARAGYRSDVLISFGSFWFPWFMRRLAERPANIFFLVRNLFSG